MNFQTRLTTAIATGAVLLNALAPLAFASTDLTISGNGSNSDSNVNVSNNSSTSVSQANVANVNNNVNTNSNTGGNHANGNTGGDVTVNTGSTNSTVNLSTQVNKNQADVSNCNCAGNTTVNVTGNGSHSDNDVKLNNNSTVNVSQANEANVSNNVNTTSNTGKNHTNDNTGGDVSVSTGDANSHVSVSTAANANVANVGGSGNGGGETSIVIAGNGSHSDNDVRLYDNPSLTISQANVADIYNDVNTKLTTGKNHANDNTGGDVTVETGNAKSNVGIDNMANFNSASADCGCVTDLTAKIAGNGEKSDNDIKASLGGDQEFAQASEANLGNDVYGDLKTGKNHANDNTGTPEGGDPSVSTGNADSSSWVNNSANANVVGNGSMDDMFGGAFGGHSVTITTPFGDFVVSF